MAGWSDLAVELLIEIAEELEAQEDRLNLASTSHHHRSILNSIAYRDITIRHPYHLADAGGDSFRRFARTMMLSPVLGDCVKTLHLDFVHHFEGWVQPGVFNCSLNASELEALYRHQLRRDIADDIRLFVKITQIRGLSNGLVRACGSWGQLVLLLHHLPNLSLMAIRSDHNVQCLGYAAVGKLLGGIPAGLKSLKRMSLRYGNGEGVFDTASVVPLMVLPGLKVLSVDGFIDDNRMSAVDDLRGVNPIYPGTWVTFTPRCSSIQELRLTWSAVGINLLHDILGLVRELRIIEYTMDFPSEQDAPGEESSIFARIIDCLSPHHHSLQNLLLSDNWKQSFSSSNVMDIRSKQPMLQFTSLSVLRIPALALADPLTPIQLTSSPYSVTPLHAFQLPESITCIEFDLVNESVAEWCPSILAEVLRFKTSTLHSNPNLREIVFRHRQKGPGEELVEFDGTTPEEEATRTALKDHGVQLRLEPM